MKSEEYPLPSKPKGEGGIASAYVSPETRGRNGQGTPGEGQVAEPMAMHGVGGSGKTHNSLPQNETGNR
jgi:hypothetical protein